MTYISGISFFFLDNEEQTLATYLVLKEAILQGFVAWVAAGSLEQQLVLLAAKSDVIKPRSTSLLDRHTAVK